MELAINVEGQNGLNWDNWKRIVMAAEELGFAAVFRSDHFASFDGPRTWTRWNAGYRSPGWRATPNEFSSVRWSHR